MLNKCIQELDYEKNFRLWKAEEYFNPIEFPELRRMIKIDKKVALSLESLTEQPHISIKAQNHTLNRSI